MELKTKYVIYDGWHSPFCIATNRSDAEEMVLALAEEDAYKAFYSRMMDSDFYNQHKFHDLKSYFRFLDKIQKMESETCSAYKWYSTSGFCLIRCANTNWIQEVREI